MFLRILIFILSIVIGVVFIKYSYQMVRIVGHIRWAEEKLGTASSYTVWKLIGMIIIALGAMYGFGVIF